MIPKVKSKLLSKRSSVIVFSILLLSFAISASSYNLATAGVASYVKDQSSIDSGGVFTSPNIPIQLNLPVGQEFTPSVRQLDRVILGVFDNDLSPPTPITMTANIRVGSITGAVVGTSDVTPITTNGLKSTSAYTVVLDFPASLCLTPGNLYVIEPTLSVPSPPGPDIQWQSDDLELAAGGPYPGGRAIVGPIINSIIDFNFETFSLAGPDACTGTIEINKSTSSDGDDTFRFAIEGTGNTVDMVTSVSTTAELQVLSGTVNLLESFTVTTDPDWIYVSAECGGNGADNGADGVDGVVVTAGETVVCNVVNRQLQPATFTKDANFIEAFEFYQLASEFVLTGDIVDPDNTLTEFRLGIDGEFFPLITTPGSQPFDFVLGDLAPGLVLPLTDATHSFDIKITSTLPSGAVVVDEDGLFNMDNVDPEKTVTSFLAGAVDLSPGNVRTNVQTFEMLFTLFDNSAAYQFGSVDFPTRICTLSEAMLGIIDTVDNCNVSSTHADFDLGNPLGEGTYTWSAVMVDAAGNSVDPPVTWTVDLTAPTVDTAKIIDSSTIEVKFDEAVTAVEGDFTGILIDGNGNSVVASSLTGSGTNTITFTLGTPLASTDTDAIGIVTIGAGVQDLAGNPFVAGNQALADAQPPVATGAEFTSGTTLDVTFSEAVIGFISDYDNLTFDSGDLGDASLDSLAGGDGPAGSATHTVTFSGVTIPTDETGSIRINLEGEFTVEDPSGNELAQTSPTVADGQPPVATGAEFTSGTTLDVTYSEAVIGFIGDYDNLTFDSGADDSLLSLDSLAGGAGPAGSTTHTVTFSGVTIPTDETGSIRINFEGVFTVEDPSGNELAETSPTVADAQPPVVLTVVATPGTPAWITDATAAVNDGLGIVVTFSEPMDITTAFFPGFGFINNPPVFTTITRDDTTSAWPAASNDEVFNGLFDVTDGNEEITAIDVTVSGAKDANGNLQAVTFTQTDEIQIDNKNPSIVSVSSPDGPFNDADTLNIDVLFDEGMIVTPAGTPTIALDSGGTATFASVEDLVVLDDDDRVVRFNYPIADTENSDDLEYTDTSIQKLGGDVFTDKVGNDAILTLPTAGGASDSLGDTSDVIVDTHHPVITSLIVAEDGQTAEPSPDETTVRDIQVITVCDDTVPGLPATVVFTGSGCDTIDLTGDIEDISGVPSAQPDGETNIDERLTITRALKNIHVEIFDAAGNVITADNTITLNPTVTIVTIPTNPLWDHDSTISGTATNLDLSATDKIRVDVGDGSADAVRPYATCTPIAVGSETCDWSVGYIWDPPTLSGNAHTVSARIFDDDGSVFVKDLSAVDISDDDGPVNVAVHATETIRGAFSDDGTDGDTNDQTFPWGNPFSYGITVNDLNHVDRDATTETLDGLALLTYSGTVLGANSDTSGTLTGDGGTGATATATANLVADGPAAIGAGHSSQVDFDGNVDYGPSADTTCPACLEILIHETTTSNDVEASVTAGRETVFAGLVRDLDDYNDFHKSTASLIGLDMDYPGTGGFGATDKVKGVEVTKVRKFADIIVDPAPEPEFPAGCNAAPLVDCIDPGNDQGPIATPSLFVEAGSVMTIPEGIDKLAIDIRNMKTIGDVALITATTLTPEGNPGTLEVEVEAAAQGGPYPVVNFDGENNKITSVTVESFTISGETELAMGAIRLSDQSLNREIVADIKFDGLKLAAETDEAGFTDKDGSGLYKIAVRAGTHYKAITTPLQELDELDPDFEVIGDFKGSPKFKTSKSGVLGTPTANKYRTTLDVGGFGSSISLTEDSGKGFTSLGCVWDPDLDGVCSPFENDDKVVYNCGGSCTAEYILPVTTSNEFGNPQPSLSGKPEIYVEYDWLGPGHKPTLAMKQAWEKAFRQSPIIDRDGNQQGLTLHLIEGEDIEADTRFTGTHLEEMNAWTDRDTDKFNDFNALKNGFFGDKTERTILGTTSGSITGNQDNVVVTGTLTDSVLEITGITVTSPEGRTVQVRGEMTATVRVPIGVTADVIRNDVDAKYNIVRIKNPAVLNDKLEVFRLIVNTENDSVDPNVKIFTLTAKFKLKIQNDVMSAGGLNPYDFGTIKIPFDLPSGATLGTALDGFNSPSILTNLQNVRAQFIHYVIFAHSVGPCGPSGVSEYLGNDFIVSLGCNFGPFENTLSTVSSTDVPDFTGARKNTRGYALQIQGTFMHELGHNLGLKHGGPDKIRIASDGTVFSPPITNGDANVNCKPNYPSVMSYSRQFPNFLSASNFDLDYSEGQLAQIQEGSLSEAAGMPSTATFVHPNLGAAYNPLIVYKSQSAGKIVDASSPSGSVTPVDWSGDNFNVPGSDPPSESGLSIDLNNFGINGCDGAGTIYNDYDDWNNLKMDFKGAKGVSFDGEGQDVQGDENGNGNADAEKQGPSYGGLLFFNTLNVDGTNTVPSNEQEDIQFQYVSCDYNNELNDDAEDDCIDPGIVERALFYTDPANVQESLAVATAACTFATSPAGGSQDPDDVPACNAQTLEPLLGQDIRIFADKSGDGLPRIELFTPGFVSGDPSTIRGFFEDSPGDGVYHYILNPDDLSGLGTYFIDIEVYKNGVLAESLYDLTVLGEGDDRQFFEFTNDDDERVSAIIEVIEPPPPPPGGDD